MKRFLKMLSIGILAFSLAACSCKKDTSEVKMVLKTSANIYSDKITTQDLYEFMQNNEELSLDIKIAFTTVLLEEVLDLENNITNKKRFDLKVKEFFEENILSLDTYKYNDVFDEELLVAQLKSELFQIDTTKTLTSGPTFELGLKYDYSDYINKTLKYSLYTEILKEDYIAKNRQALLNNSKTRIISVFSTDDLEEMETIVNDLFEGKYDSLEDVAQIKKDEAIEEIGRQYCLNLGYENEYYEGTCTASTSSSTYDSALHKFTVCENNEKCSPSEGLAYQVKLINETEYVKEQVVNKNTTDILYSKALEQLFRDDVKDRLHEVIEGEDSFLINGIYNDETEFNRKNIILFDGSADTYYLVTVRVIDSQTQSIEDKERGYAELLDKVDQSIIIHYFEDLNVEVNDPLVKEYYNKLMGIK